MPDGVSAALPDSNSMMRLASAASQALRGIIDPLVGQELQVRLADTGWIDEQLGLDVDVRALASYLDQPQLPLKMARELFLKTFIGDAT